MIKNKRMAAWVILFLMLSLAGAIVWLCMQTSKVNTLETMGNTVMTDELSLSINQIDEYKTSKDQVLLGNLYSELFTMDAQAYRLSNYLHDSAYEIPADSVSPASQLDQLMRMNHDPQLLQEYLNELDDSMKNFVASGKLSSVNPVTDTRQLLLFWGNVRTNTLKFHKEHQLP